MPELNPWSWQVNAWNHYRTAIILLEEISVHPDMPQSENIWRILDYVFLQPPGLTPDEKSIAILSEAKDRLSVYSRLKRMKFPINLVPRVRYLFEMCKTTISEMCTEQIGPNAESTQVLNSQSGDATAAASADDQGAISYSIPQMPTPVTGPTDIDFRGESQYSPYADIETIEDIDWVSKAPRREPRIHAQYKDHSGSLLTGDLLDALGLYAVK